MNTNITIYASASAVSALRCAYDTLLSFDIVEDVYMKENIYTVYGNLIYGIAPYLPKGKKPNCLKLAMWPRIPCLITIIPIADTACHVCLAANMTGLGDSANMAIGRTNEIAAEFLKRFSGALENINI